MEPYDVRLLEARLDRIELALEALADLIRDNRLTQVEAVNKLAQTIKDTE